MSRYTVKITDKAGYNALSVETQRLFDKDMRKLERNPHNPAGMRSVAIPPGKILYEANAASNRVIIRYRILEKLIEVHITHVIDPMRR